MGGSEDRVGDVAPGGGGPTDWVHLTLGGRRNGDFTGGVDMTGVGDGCGETWS